MPWSVEVRALRGDLSQMEFATKIGVALSTLGYWEQGKIAPHKRTRERIRYICKSEIISVPPLAQMPVSVAGQVDPEIWKEFRKISEAIGRNPQELLNEIVNFSMRKMATQPHRGIPEEKKKGKNS